MARFKQEYAGKDGWSRWVTPIRKGYRLGCCDCSLVHTMEFRVVQVSGRQKIQFRCRRNARSTAALRRNHGVTVK